MGVSCHRVVLCLSAAFAVLVGGCALSHERPRVDAGGPVAQCQEIGLITWCYDCAGSCCQRFCQPDRRWSQCSNVPNACDAGVGVADLATGSDR